MRTVIATLDASATARHVLDTAIGIGRLLGAELTAVHVNEGRSDTPEWLAAHEGVPLRLLEGGNVERLLLNELADPEAIAAVCGARRTTGGSRRVGHIAQHLLEQSSKPIVIVPPATDEVLPRSFRRLLVPLEGSMESSEPVIEALDSLVVADVDLVVLHVFTPQTTPRFLDRPHRDLELWSEEFLARYCPKATVIELRSGYIGNRVEELCVEQQADMIVLSWSQNMSRGHATVIRDVLDRSSVPVMLLPVCGTGQAISDRSGAAG